MYSYLYGLAERGGPGPRSPGGGGGKYYYTQRPGDAGKMVIYSRYVIQTIILVTKKETYAFPLWMRSWSYPILPHCFRNIKNSWNIQCFKDYSFKKNHMFFGINVRNIYKKHAPHNGSSHPIDLAPSEVKWTSLTILPHYIFIFIIIYQANC